MSASASATCKATGAILDALVAEGANQINGPSLTIDKPEQAMDEARVKAIAVGQARAELYARALGKRVVRLLSVSESGGYAVPPPMPMMRAQMADSGAAKSCDRSRRAADPGQRRDELRASVDRNEKGRAAGAARPFVIGVCARLADRAAADEIDHRQQDHRAEQ